MHFVLVLGLYKALMLIKGSSQVPIRNQSIKDDYVGQITVIKSKNIAVVQKSNQAMNKIFYDKNSKCYVGNIV